MSDIIAKPSMASYLMAEQNSNVLNEPTNCEPQDYMQDDEEDKLETIRFKKWQAPYSRQGGDTTYHNALVYGAEPGEQLSDMSPIEVHALFINPIHKAMMPCPNYLKGACKYTSHMCCYSHGEVVLQSRLREYREPDFSLVKPGYRVLVQHLDKLWHPAIVYAILDNSLCYVKLESNGTRLEVELHNVMPLGDDDTSDSTESSIKCENEPIPEPIPVEPVEEILEAPPSPPLECWEIPIKGVGWKLMARMGYVTGTGLGKHRDGRVSPVKADILPRGKSLDHCMLLREHAGVDENLLEVDRRLVKSRIEAQQRARRTQQQFWKQVRLLKRKNECDRQTRQLEIRRAVRDVAQLEKSLSRHSTGSTRHCRIAEKLKDKQGELNQLQASQHSIDQECSVKEDQKKKSLSRHSTGSTRHSRTSREN